MKAGGLFESGYSDIEIGVISLIVSIIILIFCLLGIVKVMQSILEGPAEKYVVAGLNYNFPGGGYLAILIGAGLTLLVQSSSITTFYPNANGCYWNTYARKHVSVHSWS